jgi:PAS domain S-box-containing protein
LTTNRSDQDPKRKTVAIVAGLVVLAAILLLTFNVTREIKLLGSAKSDNVQWSLSQTEVEFLNFSSRLSATEPNLADIRRKFDVFYSRIATVGSASVFAELRENQPFKEQLSTIQDFLADSVKIIDSNDTGLLESVEELAVATSVIRPAVRRLANSGLEQFAQTSDKQRRAVARTMTELAFALISLIGALAFFVYYLYRLNKRTTLREREQKQTATRMNTVMSTSLDGVIVSNSEGRIIEFSPAAEMIFGHSVKDVLGKEIGEVIVPDNLKDAHDAGMVRMREGGEKRVVGKGRVTLEAKHADGSLFPVELAIQSALTDEGKVFIAFQRDISKRVADQEELVSTRDRALAGEKMKTDFLATMSHEIRTPLNGLLGNMDLLKDTKLNTTQSRYVRNMQTSGRLLMSHISDVLDITRYDAGKLSTRSAPLDISALMQDIIDSQSSMAAANETTLDWGWSGKPLSWINSDHDRLQHVLINLIGNAVKFTKRGKVSLTATTEKVDDVDTITFEISDTGPGISQELIEHIFDDFVTGNTAYDREVGGTGLGLSIAKRFVNALDGEIWVESVEGEGSQFFVKVPVTIADPIGELSATEPAVQTNTKFNVLLVEDNEINRIVAREMLESDGHSVTEAHDGQEGVEKSQSETYDLILMDISMPIMDGRTAARNIRKQEGASSKSCIIALTANAMKKEQESFIADGMNGVLTKPLTKDALRKIMNHIETDVAENSRILVDTVHASETRQAVGEEAFKTLMGRFQGEVEELLDWLMSDAEIAASDIVKRCHKVAGSAAVFGFVELREKLKEIGTDANFNTGSGLEKQTENLSIIWNATKATLT